MELQRWPRLWPHCHLVYPCFPIHDLGPGSPMFPRLHPIKINTTYQLWSPVSKINDGCIERHSHNNIVNCKGNFNDGINSKFDVTTFKQEQRNNLEIIIIIIITIKIVVVIVSVLVVTLIALSRSFSL